MSGGCNQSARPEKMLLFPFLDANASANEKYRGKALALARTHVCRSTRRRVENREKRDWDKAPNFCVFPRRLPKK